MTDAILTLNAGSSSIKFALFVIGISNMLSLTSHGSSEIDGPQQHFIAKDPAGAVLKDERWTPEDQHFQPVLEHMMTWAENHLGQNHLIAAGHRVVHGGPDHYNPERVTKPLLEALDRLIPLAPLHEPHNIAPIRAIMAARPNLPQIACFDTAFHHTMPAAATRFALPREYEAAGVRRYGFHGLSYEYVAGRLREIAPDLATGRIIAAHLGNGASLCAMQDGRSVDTTMGFSALDGLMMGTRCGRLDPGVILYLEQECGLTAGQIQDLLYKQSGLLGVSGGISSDMRALLTSKDPRAKEAIDLFVYNIVREIGALTSTLGGLEGIIFTAGIGENAPEIRAGVCERLGWLGVVLDEKANAHNAGIISTTQSRVAVHVIPANEEVMIAHHTLNTIRQSATINEARF